MLTRGVFDTTIQVLDKVLRLRTQKLQAISANIANAETPGYDRIRVDFEEELRMTVGGSGTDQAVTHPRHMPASAANGIESVQARVYRENDQSGIGDGNNVSLDQEMVDLSENQIRFEAAIRMLNQKFSMLKYVIQEKV